MKRRTFLKTAATVALVSPQVLHTPAKALPLENENLLSTQKDGLPKGKPKSVIVAGAGMAGLVAAHELKKAGHRVTILEAARRAGGRVWTLREPFFTHGLYAEGGAMRLPAAHKLTMSYVKQFGLETQPFIMQRRKQFLYIDDHRWTWSDFYKNPNVPGYRLKETERGKVPGVLWEETVEPISRKMKAKGMEGWHEILDEWGDFTTRQFLERNGWSQDAITLYGIVENQRARLNHSVTALLWETLTGSFKQLVEIKGGTDNLPKAFLPGLRDNIKFGAKLTSVKQDSRAVQVTYKTALDETLTVSADHLILAIPFPMLRHIEGLRDFSKDKWSAITGLNYDQSGKILLQCRQRFWEQDGIAGGGSESDLGIRSTWYPQHADGWRGTGDRGILLASYTWARDARRWGHLSVEDQVQQATEDIEKLHPQIKGKSMIEGGTSVMWHRMENYGGAFALFNPGQEKRHYEVIKQPEGRVHFAGEHTSLDHRWIEGAVESGIRTAVEIATA